MLTRAIRRVIGDRRAEAISESLNHARLVRVEHRLDVVERRLRRDLAAAVADARYGPASVSGSLLIEDHELSVYSQNGEDGILLYLVSLVGAPNRRFVELGIGDGSECNGANLARNRGWSGTMVDADRAGASRAQAAYAGLPVDVVHAFVTTDNVGSLVGAAPLDVLSIDIDGNDFWVWKAIDTPSRIAVLEYNASFGPAASVTIPYEPSFDYTTASPERLYHGASVTALAKLAVDKGMALVGCDSQGVNAFFVDRSLLSDRLPEVAPGDAWRPVRKRLTRFTQAEQERLLRDYPVVEV